MERLKAQRGLLLLLMGLVMASLAACITTPIPNQPPPSSNNPSDQDGLQATASAAPSQTSEAVSTGTATQTSAPVKDTTPTYTATLASSATPTYTPTTPPAAQIAPDDPRFNNPLNIPLDNTASVLDFVSYPDGDNEDRVRWDVTGMNPNAALPGGRARLVIAVSCFGEGIQQIELFTGGQTYSCGQTIVDQEVTANSKTGSVVITAVGGSGTYVQWVLTGTATRLN